MWNNQFSGNISTDIVEVKRLKQLLLGENHLSGIIPSSLGNRTRLLQLSLGSKNKFQGSLPSSCLGKCQALIVLDPSDSSLNNTIPTQIIGLSSSTIYLDLSRNYFTGFLHMEVRNQEIFRSIGCVKELVIRGDSEQSLQLC